MAEDERESGDDHRERTAQFLLLVSAVLAVLFAAAGPVFVSIPRWTAMLVALDVIIALAILHFRLTRAKWFPQAAAGAVVVTIVIAAIFAGTSVSNLSTSAPAPTIQFVKASPATVPWCNYFDITVSGVIPADDRLLVFDASTDDHFNVDARYSYDVPATPLARGVWTAGPIYVSSQYIQDGHGHNILKHGHPVSNAGYTVTIFALVLPADVLQVLNEVGTAAENLLQLPTHPLAYADLNVVRNGDVGQCNPSNSAGSS